MRAHSDEKVVVEDVTHPPATLGREGNLDNPIASHLRMYEEEANFISPAEVEARAAIDTGAYAGASTRNVGCSFGTFITNELIPNFNDNFSGIASFQDQASASAAAESMVQSQLQSPLHESFHHRSHSHNQSHSSPSRSSESGWRDTLSPTFVGRWCSAYQSHANI